MNIFVLHTTPRKAARWHVDRHVVKMILESVQLLYTAHWVLYAPSLALPGARAALREIDPPAIFATAPYTLDGKKRGYQPTHANHPCAVWARQTVANYRWLVQLAAELLIEYHFRFGRVHACKAHVEWLAEHEPCGIRKLPLRTPFACAMPDHIKGADPVARYQAYYREEKVHLCVYTGRHVPEWMSPPLAPSS